MLTRVKNFSINYVLSLVPRDQIYRWPRDKVFTEIEGYVVNLASDRYFLFLTQGVVCAHCGLEGKYFGLDTSFPASKLRRAHFNLYALTAEGKEMLMTKDHIRPKSKGGKDRLENYQVLCQKCNNRKGDFISDEWKGVF